MSGLNIRIDDMHNLSFDQMPAVIVEKMRAQKGGEAEADEFERKRLALAESAGMDSDAYLSMVSNQFFRSVMNITDMPKDQIGRSKSAGSRRKAGSHGENRHR